MKRLVFALFVPTLLTACPRDREDALTLDEATQAIQESTAASEAEGLTSSSVDIATNFTIGQGLANAGAELKAFIQAELPCAEVTLEGGTLTVEYGALPGNCVYHGRTFSGTTMITVSRNDAAQVVVDHEWIDLSNGLVSVSGTAQVTWDPRAQTRHVVHETSWVHLASGRTAQGSGDRTQSALDGDLSQGIQIDGSRAWEGPRGGFQLAIAGVQMRWSDPVPQAGSYTLSAPFARRINVGFARVDEDTIRVTVTGPQDRSFSFTVSKTGVEKHEG